MDTNSSGNGVGSEGGLIVVKGEDLTLGGGHTVQYTDRAT